MRKSLGMAMLATVVGLGLATQASAQDTMTGYGESGLKVSNGNYSMAISTQMQQRLTIVDNHGLTTGDQATFNIRRLKTNFHGNVFSKDWSYNFTYDWRGAGVEQASIGYKVGENMSLHMGSTKLDFNLEESTSSKRQSFADRSNVNQAFNLDFATGLWLKGSSKMGDGALNYSFGIFNGIHGADGRNTGDSLGWTAGPPAANTNIDTDFMLNGRIGYTPFSNDGRIAKYASDLRSDDNRDMDLYLGLGLNYAMLDETEGLGTPGPAGGPYGSGTTGSIALDARLHMSGISLNASYFYRNVSAESNGTPNVETASHASGLLLSAGYNMNLEGGDQFEVAARFGYTNHDDPSTGPATEDALGGADVTEGALALNYRFNKEKLKATFDINYENTEGHGLTAASNAAVGQGQDVWTFTFQVQLLF